MRRLAVALLVFALVFPANAASLPPLPQGTDGCSGGVSSFWRNVTHRVPVWETCCYAHDPAYRIGGTWTDRARADQRLFVCIVRSDPFAGTVMFVALAVFGQVNFKFDLKRLAADHAARHVYERAGAE